MRRRHARRIALTGLIGALIVLVSPGFAYAHGTDGVDDSDYLVTVTSVPAELSGVEVRAVEAGSRLEIVNDGALSVEVLGYSGEPYLRVDPTGAYVNVYSPAAYLNDNASGDTAVPGFASAAQAPYFQLATAEPRIRWYDHRAHWMNAEPPAMVAADPASDHRVLAWSIPLRVGVTTYHVTGTLDWLAPPSKGTWIAVTLLVGAGVAAVGVSRKVPPSVARWTLIAGAAAAGVAAAADAVGRSMTSADLTVSWGRLLVTSELWPVMGALAAVGAAAYAVARRPAADLAIGVAGVCVAMFSGLSRVTSFGYAITATPWPGDVERTLLVVTLGVGAGLAVAALVRARRSGAAF